MSITTKKGDAGTTQLLTGERVEKNSPRIIAVGYLDEATSHLGKVKSLLTNTRLIEIIEKIQSLFISMMGTVASTHPATNTVVTEEDVRILEQLIDYYEGMLEPFTSFILPGESPLTAEIHIARTVVRRAETALQACEVPVVIKKYVNRLSDYLYTLARYLEIPTIEKEAQVKMGLTLDRANKVIEEIKAYATYKNCNVVVAVLSSEGRPISVQAMDGAFIISYDLAIKKAFTAVALRMPNHELGKLTAEGADFYGLEGMLEEKIVTLGGGCPAFINGQLIGGIGVSGGSATEDIDFAAYGAKILEKEGYI